MISVDLRGKTVLMTGALGAIAEHIVRRLHQAGATLVLTDVRSSAEAQALLTEWEVTGERTNYVQMDVTDPNQVSRIVREAFAAFPRMDLVLGHAGGCVLHPFATTSQEHFDNIFKLNYLSQTYLARAVLQEWTSRSIAGHLLFTSSYVARVPHTRIPAYATAKAALESLVKCLALEYAHDNIRVNAISPGNVAAGSSLKVYEEDSEYRAFVDRVSPLAAGNSPEAVADVFLFLSSDLAREINGQIVSVDMGVSIPKIG